MATDKFREQKKGDWEMSTALAISKIDEDRARAHTRLWELLWGSEEAEPGELKSVLDLAGVSVARAKELAAVVADAKHQERIIEGERERQASERAAQQRLYEGMAEIQKTIEELREKERKLRLEASAHGSGTAATEARRKLNDLRGLYPELFHHAPANVVPTVHAFVRDETQRRSR
jgi:hypothetical protein